MKYIKEFEKYELNGEQVYCIYVPNKVNSAFTKGKYYDVYRNFNKSKGETLKVKNNNGTLKEIYDLNQTGQIFKNAVEEIWIPSINDILNCGFPVYLIFGSNACFIKSEDIEIYNLMKDFKGDTKKYNL